MIEKHTKNVFGIKNDTILAWHLFISAQNNPNKRFIHICEKNTVIYSISFLLSFFNELYEKHISISKLKKDSSSSSEVFNVFQSSSSGIILLHRDYCNEHFPSTKTINESSLNIDTRENYSPQKIGEKLIVLGYERVSHTPNHGEFSIHGSSIEIRESNENKDERIRIYFDENSIEKININNTDVSKISIPPRFIDNLPRTESIFSIISENDEISLYQKSDETLFMLPDDIKCTIYSETKNTEEKNTIQDIKNTPHHAKLIIDAIKEKINEKWHVIICCTEENERNVRAACRRHDFDPSKYLRVLPEDQIILINSFSDAARRTLLIRDTSFVYGEYRNEKKKQRIDTAFIMSIRPHDYVVHSDHGIGIFHGMVMASVENIYREYFDIRYAENDKLLLPIDQAEKISRYIGIEHPKIHRLGGTSWHETTLKIKEDAIITAHTMLKNHAIRTITSANSFNKSHPDEQSITTEFPHPETDDQLKAINDVYRDLAQTTPMDRLVCGDVGFGKTEVAVRAAARVVFANYQVALICPTTILAQQHFDTFTERFSKYGVEIELLSRFRSSSEQKESVKKIKEGTSKIVIGTHRLLSSDIHFHNLGLIIIDEEQRFGVEHKELLRQIKTGTHAMTMTATPIPRTLHLSLAGIRDMSVIQTPPHGRKEIITDIAHYDLSIIKETINRELERNGQVYYLFNSVANIPIKVKELQKLIPEARIESVHGQLPEEDIARVMHAFDTGVVDVLVCSTIIENGLDIPNANTLIVEHANDFGLSQLHQIRGRVGRSDRQAYALFTYDSQILVGNAWKRLEALSTSSSLGGGFELALRDLEIRGVGNLLGTEQHGRVSAIGITMYNKLITHAINEIQSGVPRTRSHDVVIDLPIEYGIPSSYIHDEIYRLKLYQALAGIADTDSLAEEFLAIEKKYGALPHHITNLHMILNMKLRCQNSPIKSIEMKKIRTAGDEIREKIIITFIHDVPYDALARLLDHNIHWTDKGNQIKILKENLAKDWLSDISKTIDFFVGNT